ncbi:MAG: alpha/beta fold hydrolase [Bacilli bacterium]|nr:alpha/beta fold hydrolase [Bacilli bacterium]
MLREDILLNSECDNNPLSIAVYKPEGEIKGIIQISHGMIEHKLRYKRVMEHFANKGYVVVMSDHRGHGFSTKSSDDLGYFYDDTAEYVVEDLHQVTEYIKSQFPNKDITLIGHSMGSLVARKYLKKYDNEISKLVVCGSPSNNEFVGLGIALIKIVKLFKGDRYRSQFFQNLTIGNFNKSFKEGKDAWFSPNQEVIKSVKEDKYSNFTFTLNGFLNLYNLLKDVYNAKNYEVKNKDLGILFLSGQDDKALVNKSKWFASQDLLRNVGYNNITCKLYPGFRHEVLNEINNEFVFEDILNFIEK